MRKPSHRKNNPNWPRKHGRSRKVSFVPPWMSPAALHVLRTIQHAFDRIGATSQELTEAIDRDIEAQRRHADSGGSTSSG